MTSAPVPLAEQPTDEEIGRSIAGLIGVRLNYEAQGAGSEALELIDLARKVCCDYARIKQALQQHERAIAALREIADFAAKHKSVVDLAFKRDQPSDRLLIAAINKAMNVALLDDAASTAGDAVTTEEDKQNHGDEDRC